MMRKLISIKEKANNKRCQKKKKEEENEDEQIGQTIFFFAMGKHND